MLQSIVVSFVLSFASMAVISLYIAPANAQHAWFSIIFTYFDMLFAFVLGACINYKLEVGTITIPRLQDNQTLTFVFLVAWFAIHLLTGSAAVGPFFLMAFMVIFINLEIKGIVRKVLLELGRKSMVMWLVHAFYYAYLCHDFIYGFKYPLLIFLVLILVSYLTAIVIQWVSKHTIDRLPVLRN